MTHNGRLPYRIETRIDKKKYMELKGQLERSNYNTMSELLRDILYNRRIVTVTHDKSMDYIMEKLTAIRSELHAIGININQVTKYFNNDPNPHMKLFYAKGIGDLYLKAGRKTEDLLSFISKAGEQWLQN